MAKHRTGVPEPLLLVVEQTMLKAGAHATGRAFRSQAEVHALAVVEAEHLFFDDVGHLADGALEQRGLFQ